MQLWRFTLSRCPPAFTHTVLKNVSHRLENALVEYRQHKTELLFGHVDSGSCRYQHWFVIIIPVVQTGLYSLSTEDKGHKYYTKSFHVKDIQYLPEVRNTICTTTETWNPYRIRSPGRKKSRKSNLRRWRQTGFLGGWPTAVRAHCLLAAGLWLSRSRSRHPCYVLS